MTKHIRLDQREKKLRIKECVIDHPLVFDFFNSQPDDKRDSVLAKALAIGVLALMEDRLSTFLSKTSNRLGTELESLKLQFDLAQQLFLKSTVKGRDAEGEIRSILEQYGRTQGYLDEVKATGDSYGALPNNKSGDLMIEVHGREAGRIVVESKFDRGKRLGLISEKDILSKSDTAVGQLLEALVNRSATAAIIVFDREVADSKLLADVGAVKYVAGCGFVCIVDSQRGDYSNLLLSYDIARSALFARQRGDLAAQNVLSQIVGRFLHDLDLFQMLKRKLRESAVDIFELSKLVDKAMLSIEFSKEVFQKFMVEGGLSSEELLRFYLAPEVRKKYEQLEHDIHEVSERKSPVDR